MSIEPEKTETIQYDGGENVDLRSILIRDRKSNLSQKTKTFYDWIQNHENVNKILYRREILSEAGPEVLVKDKFTGETKKLLMFGSNNYLGLASHPLVKEKVIDAIKTYGVGIGGPPLLNGYTKLHKELEEKLSEFKGKEDSLIFSSGYSANLGLIASLVESKSDVVFYDAFSHASFFDGIKMSRAPHIPFAHNNSRELSDLMDKNYTNASTKIIGVEGVYSMDGDMAPLDEMVKIAKQKNAIIILDDAHGTLVKGKNGRGSAEEFNVENDVDIIMSTFSKAFAVSGAFVSSSKEIINYLRYLARPYMFSASLPIPSIAAVLAGLEVNRNEPELRANLLANTKYLADNIRKYGLVCEPEAAIIALRVPSTMNIKKASFMFHELGIFVNSIEYPAVPESEQRIRISLMATHTREHLDRLIESIDFVFSCQKI